jgi:hypothetical protein
MSFIFDNYSFEQARRRKMGLVQSKASACLRSSTGLLRKTNQCHRCTRAERLKGRSHVQRVLSRSPTPRLPTARALLSPRVGQRCVFRSHSGCLGGEKLTDYSVLAISAALVVMGLAILVNAGLEFVELHSPASWPTTIGSIASVQVAERDYRGEIRWFPQVTYEYSVQGRTVMNTRLASGPQVYWRDRSEANHFLGRGISCARR